MLAHQLPPVYRLFPIDAVGHVAGVPDVIYAVDDAQAVQEAARLVRDRTVELWTGVRLVATLNRPDRR